MTRSEPTYDLRFLQQLVGQGPISSIIMRPALDGSAALQLHPEDVVDAVLMLDLLHFYKSMEAERSPGLWQDVYHLPFRGTWIYLKLQLLPDGRAAVVQFKRR